MGKSSKSGPNRKNNDSPIDVVLKAFPEAEPVPGREGAWTAVSPLDGEQLGILQTKTGAVAMESDGEKLAGVLLDELLRCVGLKIADLFPFGTFLSPEDSTEISHKPRKGFDERFEPVITCMADVISEPIKWLWPGYVALRKVCLIEGDPNQGKTWLCLAMAAAVSQGVALPDSETGQYPKASKSMEPGKVLYLTAEDGSGDTIKPRLESLGADCSRIYVIDGQRRGDEAIQPVTLKDQNILQRALEMHKPRLLIIDPLQGFLGSNVDMNRANQVRPVLADMMRLAENYNCAIIIVRHLNKAQAGKAAYRGMGSIDFTAAARTILLVGRDPDDPAKRVIIPTKCNVGIQGTSLAFSLTPDMGFQWAGKAAKTAEDILYPMVQENQLRVSALDEAQDFLQNILEYGPVSANEIFAKSDKAGISKATIRRAKEHLKIQAFREPGKGRDARWLWKIRCANISDERLEQVIKTPSNTSLGTDDQGAQSKIGEHLNNVRRFPPRKGNKR